MKKKTLGLITISILIFIFVIVIGGFTIKPFFTRDIFLEKDGSHKTVVQIQDELMKKEKGELIRLLSGLNTEVKDPEILMLPFSVFMSRINEYTEEDLIKIILDTSNTDLVRATLVEFMYLSPISQSDNKYSELPESIKDLLYDKHSDEMLKINILYSLDSSKERDYKILEEFSKCDNLNVAAVANKVYSKVKKETTILSGGDDTFVGYDKNSKENIVLREKIFAKARTFNVPEESVENPEETAALRKEFIDKCFDIYDESIDIDLKETCIYAIRDTCDYRGIKEIIQRDNIEEILKIGTVNDCYTVLLFMLQDNPTIEDVMCVAKALDVVPLNDFYEPLKQASKILSTDDLEIVNAVLEKVKNSDTGSNPNYLDYNQRGAK